MTKEKNGDVVEKLYEYVIEQMNAGADKPTIAQKLIEMGMQKNDADSLIDVICSQIVRTAAAEKPTPSSIVPAILGGLVAALVGGYLWGLIASWTGYVIGYMAWGIGVLCGFAVVFATSGKKGWPLQLTAVFTRIIGILAGKYCTFCSHLEKYVLKEYGSDAASNVTLISSKVFSIFSENLGSLMSGFDLLWFGLAIVSAWTIPKGIGLKSNAVVNRN